MPAINEQQLIHSIKELQKTHALESLQKPTGKDPFDYGHACGVAQGITPVEALITKLLHGEEKTNEKQRSRSPSPYAP